MSPGSKVSSAPSASARIRAWVDLPQPSTPSKAISRPRWSRPGRHLSIVRAQESPVVLDGLRLGSGAARLGGGLLLGGRLLGRGLLLGRRAFLAGAFFLVAFRARCARTGGPALGQQLGGPLDRDRLDVVAPAERRVARCRRSHRGRTGRRGRPPAGSVSGSAPSSRSGPAAARPRRVFGWAKTARASSRPIGEELAPRWSGSGCRSPASDRARSGRCGRRSPRRCRGRCRRLRGMDRSSRASSKVRVAGVMVANSDAVLRLGLAVDHLAQLHVGAEPARPHPHVEAGLGVRAEHPVVGRRVEELLGPAPRSARRGRGPRPARPGPRPAGGRGRSGRPGRPSARRWSRPRSGSS